MGRQADPRFARVDDKVCLRQGSVSKPDEAAKRRAVLANAAR